MKTNRLLTASLAALLLSGAITSCGDDDPADGSYMPPIDDKPDPGESTLPDDKPATDIDKYVAPTYNDDYRSIAGWAQKDKWNLANVHDPSIAYFDGYYYMYGTDASYGNEHLKNTNGKHFPGKRSKNLVDWEFANGPFNDVPDWVLTKLNEIRKSMELPEIASKNDVNWGYWAPVIRTVNGKLRMYYSIVVDNYIKSGKKIDQAFDGSWSERAFIGMCETSDPWGGNWEDKGYVTCSSSDKGLNYTRAKQNGDWGNAYFFYNAIDPTYIVTSTGEHWLIHGSWHSGFAALQIDPTTGKPLLATDTDPWAENATLLQERFGRRIGTRTANNRWQGSEAPEVIEKDGYFYLFMAYDGLDVPYNTRVVRSKSIDGSAESYFDITGRNFTNGRGDCYPIVTHPYKFNGSKGWVGISHCCVFQNETTKEWFYCSQGRFPNDAGGNAPNAVMLGHVRKIYWCPNSPDALDDIWPIPSPERYAAVPTVAITQEDLVGKWEHINLEYKYAEQNVSKELELKADGTMSGALTGTWSYDAAKKYLTLDAGGTKSIVVVDRECDWEANPRKATIVYAGIENATSAPKTFWGKKVE